MKTKAAASALAVLLLVAALLPSCGERGEPGGTSRTTDGNTVSGTGTDTENNNLELPDDGFGGRDFRVLAGNRIKWPMWDTVDLTVDESSDPQISSAVFSRNSMVEKRLDVVIKSDIITSADPWTRAEELFRSGDDFFEAYLMILNKTSGLVAEGLLRNLYDIPYLNTENPWWDSAAARDSGIYGRLYFAMGDINVTDDSATWACFINKELAKDIKITTGYQTVLDGSWTMDVMITDSLAATKDLNGDHVYDQSDRWGTVHQNEAIAAFFASFGGYTVRSDRDGSPEFVADTAEMIDYLQYAIDFNFLERCQCTAEDFRASDPNNYFNVAKEIFTTGRGLYYIGPILTVADAEGLRAMDDEYGILPMPKYSEAQKEYRNSFQYSNATVYSIPVQNTRDELTGAVLEAMAYYSTDTLRKGYYTYVLGEKGSRDDESKQMLDLIFRTRINDLGFVYDWGGMITVYYYMAQNQISPVTMFRIKDELIRESMNKTLSEIRDKTSGGGQ
ncbi:MAG: hypothetical protein KIG76_05780 [Eubacteriales bacterium]|nr:hypothetical protein [Candidatus Colimorpha enterica]